MALLEAHALSKAYAGQEVFADLSLQLAAGEMVALLGESGSGKSTLMNCLAGLDRPDSGSVWLDGVELSTLSEPEQARLRRAKLGFVFQAFHLLPHLSVADNIALPLLLLQRPDPARVQEMLASVGLQGLGARMPRQLSGGQMQRVAIARALVHRPALVLADEPTGNLDASSAGLVLDLLQAQVQSQGAACLLVTHSERAAACAHRCLRLDERGLSEVNFSDSHSSDHNAH
ncbi:ABC transporter ATP-binding protein [Paucibacter sp. AS339]|uniref:ABC transporter ATP-binding protein n=1 Tax=Paucibacter hankyongi TaxID=3133434 RepID=UPI0030A308DA